MFTEKDRGDNLKININQNSSFDETEITINCKFIDKNMEKIISMLRIMEYKLTGTKNGQTYIINPSDVYYIDTADKKTFFYTEAEVYESTLRLYELEEQLSSLDFFRANKATIINLNKIKSIKADIDGKLIVTMENMEKQIVSRQYAPNLKKKLGVK